MKVKTRLAIRKVGAGQELYVESSSFSLAILIGSLQVEAISFSNV
jgi:hypothetical protein